MGLTKEVLPPRQAPSDLRELIAMEDARQRAMITRSIWNVMVVIACLIGCLTLVMRLLETWQ